jgi:toxin ParE1/3/4
MRGFPVGNYVIFYRDTSEHIEIVRVLHGARDIENLF